MPRNGFRGPGYDYPYTRNILRPAVGLNEFEGETFDTSDLIGEGINSFMTSYQAQKDQRKQDRLDRQNQALKIAEMQGEVTPELEEAIMGPLQPEDATRGQQAIGGLGRMLGMDTDYGIPQEPFERTGGPLLTKGQRDAEAATIKHERDIQMKQEESDIDLEQQRKEVEEELKFVDSQKKKIERIKATAEARSKWKTGKALSAREKLQNDLYAGTKNLTNLTPEDYLILGKYWSSSTPASRSKEAIRIATDLWAADQKGKVKKGTKEERDAFIDEVSGDIIAKQDDLMSTIQQSEIEQQRGRGLYGATGQGRPTMDQIWMRQ